MQYSDHQMEDLLRLRRLFCLRMGQLARERRALLANLSHCKMDWPNHVSDKLTEMTKWSDLLRENAAEEYRSYMQILTASSRGVPHAHRFSGCIWRDAHMIDCIALPTDTASIGVWMLTCFCMSSTLHVFCSCRSQVRSELMASAQSSRHVWNSRWHNASFVGVALVCSCIAKRLFPELARMHLHAIKSVMLVLLLEHHAGTFFVSIVLVLPLLLVQAEILVAQLIAVLSFPSCVGLLKELAYCIHQSCFQRPQIQASICAPAVGLCHVLCQGSSP